MPAKKAHVATANAVLVTTKPETEVEAYAFIREQLSAVGWIVKNPERFPDGQVWTQNQARAHPEIKRCLGLTTPENIVKLSETQFWPIESKAQRNELGKALSEAEDIYAWPLNNGGVVAAPLITGVAGNDASGYEVRTRLLVGGKYETVTINDIEATGFPDPHTVTRLLSTGNPHIADMPIDEGVFLRAAEAINKTLHNGGINKNDRARLIAALLLALIEGAPDLDRDLPVLINDINTRTEEMMRKHGKKEFAPFMRIEPPTNPENHVKYKAALVRTTQTLNNLNIKSAMNSGADVLGKFYEVFLRYGNGAKEIGIVLTPRHVTRFAAETLGVGPNDIVLDPACGTGGFLVAAFDQMRKNASHAQVERFRKHSLFGIEQESAVAALAIVNMIFRGDGKNHIVEANCFSKFLRRSTTDGVATAAYVNAAPKPGDEAVTRVFMNPPFALKESDAKEYRFVETALHSMADGGLLFAIVPMSVMAEGGDHRIWRKDTLLARHTVLSVISLPEELFYPVMNQTVAVIIRKGVPHAKSQPVLWGRVTEDGFIKSKGRRLPAPVGARNDLTAIAPILRGFLLDPSQSVKVVPEFVRKAPIDWADPILELVPEAYVESAVPGVQELNVRLDSQVREDIAGLVTVDLKYGGGGVSIIDQSSGKPTRGAAFGSLPKFRPFAVEDLFDLYAGDFHSLGDVDPGTVPVASCSALGNGIIGSYNVPAENVYKDALTVAFNGSPLATMLHPYAFGAKDDVAVCIPRQKYPPEALLFMQAALNAERWRFSYYRKCFMGKLKRIAVELPVTGDGTLNVDFMVKAVRAQSHWWFLAPRLKGWKPVISQKSAG